MICYKNICLGTLCMKTYLNIKAQDDKLLCETLLKYTLYIC